MPSSVFSTLIFTFPLKMGFFRTFLTTIHWPIQYPFLFISINGVSIGYNFSVLTFSSSPQTPQCYPVSIYWIKFPSQPKYFSLTDARARHPSNVGLFFLTAVLNYHFLIIISSLPVNINWSNIKSTSYGLLHGRS